MIKQSMAASYMKQFQCLGSTCEDTCCSGWSVDIDKKTFLKYKQLPDKKLKRTLAGHIRRNKYETSFTDYAKIRFNDQGFCPFLNQEKLCSIQLKLGERYLSQTCKNYPRQHNLLYSTFELSASVSCPEIARLALLNPEGITLEPIDENVDEVSLDKNFADDRFLPYFELIRSYVIEVLQNRSLSIDTRLLQLGLFLQELSELVDREQLSDIPATIANYRELTAEELSNTIGALPVQNEFQLETLCYLTDDFVSNCVTSKRYLECYEQFAQGIDRSAERMKAAYEDHYTPFIQEHEYIMENYLVNYVLFRLFPFFHKRTIYQEYNVMVLHYALIKFHLIGLGAYHQGLTSELVIKLIQLFARNYENDTTYFQKALEILTENEYTSLPHMAMLIRN